MNGNHVEKIEDFLSGKMTVEEQEFFQRELESNKELFAVYNTYLSIETHMHKSGEFASEKSLKNALAKLGAEYFGGTSAIIGQFSEITNGRANPAIDPSNITPRQIWRPGYIILGKVLAAIFIFAVGLGLTWYFSGNYRENKVAAVRSSSSDSVIAYKPGNGPALKSPVSSNLAKLDEEKFDSPVTKHKAQPQEGQLFAKFFEADKVPENREGPLEEAFDLYENRHFINAASAFESADLNAVTRGEESDIHLDAFYASYYKALSYLAANRPAIALQNLKNITSFPDTLSRSKVRWYLALAYLRTDSLPQALRLLETAGKDSADLQYSQKSNELIAELKSTRVEPN